ncbi:MAG: ATP-binding protein [Proteobacteria bacterium]|nr:ATP-binding protein [Pseudomonadota bacterium]
MALGRFERKIVLAMAAVALVPLAGALILGRGVLREAYEVGVNREVGSELERSLEVYRAHFVALRERAAMTADALADHWELRAAVRTSDGVRIKAVIESFLSRHPHLGAVAVWDAANERLLARAQRSERLDPHSMRLLRFARTLGSSPQARQGSKAAARLEITVGTPIAPFEDYRRAGELVDVFSRLQAGTGEVSAFYLIVYTAFLLSVILIAFGVGFVVSRRVTRRVALLAEATTRVGAGDLTVEVPTDAKDEIGELTRDFNLMVRDLRLSRERIEYLQRIGQWQQFARRLAHEIKNPLTPIQLATQEVSRSYQGNDQVFRRRLDEAVSIVEEEVATLRRLVGEFSAFARLPEPKLEAADLNAFLRDCEKSLGAVLEQTPESGSQALDVQLRCELCRQRLPVRIDTMMLRRCLDNLVRNAAQAIRAGAQPRRAHYVVLRSLRKARHAVLEVSDSGPGVPTADLATIFDPYYTTRREGTGLGLAIVKKIVLEHAGEVSCENQPDGGAIFRIVLPLAEPETSASSST